MLALLSQLILNGIPAAPYFKLGMARPGSHLTPVLIALRPALVNSNAKHIIAGMAAIAAGLASIVASPLALCPTEESVSLIPLLLPLLKNATTAAAIVGHFFHGAGVIFHPD